MRISPDEMDVARLRFARDLERLKDDLLVGGAVSEGMAVSVAPGEGSFRDGLFSSFTMILLAEIADKTFFIACIMAMRYNRLIVFSGAWGALVLMTFLSCVVGHVVTSQTWLSQTVIHYLAASLFLLFAIQMIYEGYKNRKVTARNEMEEVAAELRADDEELRVRFRKNSKSDGANPENAEVVVEIVRTDSERVRSRTEPGNESANSNNLSPDRPASADEEIVAARTASPELSPAENSEAKTILKKVESFFQIFINPVFLKAFILTFIAEWGDRSQMSTVVLAVSTDKTAVFFGGSLGHFVCTMAAVIFGRLIANRISLTYLNLAGGIIFIGFSGYTFYLAATGEND